MLHIQYNVRGHKVTRSHNIFSPHKCKFLSVKFEKLYGNLHNVLFALYKIYSLQTDKWTSQYYN